MKVNVLQIQDILINLPDPNRYPHEQYNVRILNNEISVVPIRDPVKYPLLRGTKHWVDIEFRKVRLSNYTTDWSFNWPE